MQNLQQEIENKITTYISEQATINNCKTDDLAVSINHNSGNLRFFLLLKTSTGWKTVHETNFEKITKLNAFEKMLIKPTFEAKIKNFIKKFKLTTAVILIRITDVGIIHALWHNTTKIHQFKTEELL